MLAAKLQVSSAFLPWCHSNICCFSAFTPYGDVHMFRMQLWSALLQTWEESFRYPGTLETTQRVKEMSWHNWQCYNYDKYNLDKNDLPPGKLLLYPIQVNPAFLHPAQTSGTELFEILYLLLYCILYVSPFHSKSHLSGQPPR